MVKNKRQQNCCEKNLEQKSYIPGDSDLLLPNVI